MAIKGCPDYATKAELQELRDQLNAALGTKEDGGETELFKEGVGGAVVAAATLPTLLGIAKTSAPKVITDITLAAAGTQPIWKELASGSAKLIGFRGNGTSAPLGGLTTVAKTAGGGAGGAAVGAKAAGGAAASLAVLAQLVTIAGTLALNYYTVKILDQRIDAEARGTNLQLDAINGSMLRLYEKNQGDIDKVNEQLDENQIVADTNRQNIEIAKTQIAEVRNANETLVDQLNQSQADVQELQAQNLEISQEITELNLDFGTVTSDLSTSVTSVQQQLTKALEQIETQKTQIITVNTEIDLIEAQIEEINLRLDKLEVDSQQLRDEFDLLRIDLRGDLDLADARSKLNSAKLVILEARATVTGSGGVPVSVPQGTVAGQNKLLELTNQLTANPVEIDPITTADLTNNPNKFTNLFDQLLANITGGSVDQSQLEALRIDVKTDFSDVLETALQIGVIAKLNQINNQTNQDNLQAATSAAICKSLNGGSCSATPGNPNPTQGLGGLQSALSGKMDAVNASLNSTAIAQNSAIKNIVQNTNEVVNHPTFGLKKVQEYADTAWKATHADKAMQMISTVLVIHNGMMLSNNLAQTVGEATNMGLQALGIKDSQNQPLDVNVLVKGKITSMLSSILGAENYKALTARLAKANRVYQASANMLQTTQNLFDSARSVAELTAENTGQIGNALKESGAVYEDAYRDMSEKVNPQNVAQRNLEKFRGTLEGISEPVEAISQISSEIVEISENFSQLKTEKTAWKTEIETKIVTKETEKAEAKEASQALTTPNSVDFSKNESST